MPRDFRPELDIALARLRSLIDCVRTTDTARWKYVPPIIDRDSPLAWVQHDILGYVKTVQLIEKQLAGLETLAKRSSEIKEDPLPIALSLETFWKQCLVAASPVTGTKLMMKGKGKEEAFVDVIARGGAEWIKLWTKKDKQLISEFKEQDSYVNSDWDESDDDLDLSDSPGAGPSSPKARVNGNANGQTLRNSLIDTAEALLSVASAIERPPGVASPKVTIRLTRMEEFPAGGHEDDRIPATFALLRRRGVNLVFGDLEDLDLEDLSKAPRPRSPLLPSLKINLDPTALVGLCSDILHHPLPSSSEEARERFFRPPGIPYRANGHSASHSSGEAEEGEGQEQSKNSRELYKELLEEMSHPSIESIRDTCAKAMENARRRGEEVGGVEFWVTEEALRHLKEAMCSKEVIGEGMEQRRMRRLIGLEEGDFWEGSRYEGNAGVLGDIRLHVFPPTTGAAPMCGTGMTSLHHGLADIADQFLAEYTAATSSPSSAPSPAAGVSANGSAAAESALPSFLRPDRLPIPKIVTLTLPFPIVSLQSFARGAREGMTTLTMGNVLFRELFGCPRWKLRGWVQGNYEIPSPADGVDGHAAVWMLPYRSFAEGKRVRFAAGDYSVPQMAEMI